MYGSYAFSRNDELFTLNEMVRQQPAGTELNRLFRSGRRNNFWGMVLGFSGSFVLGAALADAISGDDGDDSLNHWQTYVAAGALIGVSFPLLSTADRRIEEAVNRYNDGPPTGGTAGRIPVYYAGFLREGIGVGLRF